MEKEKIQFTSGIMQQNVPSHKQIPYTRSLMIGEELFQNSNLHLAVHFITKVKEKKKNYSQLHSHEVDEYNLLIGSNKNGKGLKYKICTDDEEYIVDSPQTIYIPAGVSHSAEAIEGEGTFICVVLKGKL